MSGHSFSLIPFPAPDIPDISITGKISLLDHLLVIHYFLAGDVEAISLPSASVPPGRKDELWKATCFEFFLAIRDEPPYWEFNMSPSGDWNVYHIDAYRRYGFREESLVPQLPFRFKKESKGYALDVSVDLSRIFRPEEKLQMAVTAIIQTKDGKESYWALAHPAPAADFHLRESFLLTLAGQAHPSEQSAPGG